MHKDGVPMMEVLRTKHPEAQTPFAASLDSYPDRPPELTPVDITNDTVAAVAGRLLGGAGQGGTDSVGVSPTLAPAVRCSQRGTSADFWGLRGVAGKWPATMGRL